MENTITHVSFEKTNAAKVFFGDRVVQVPGLTTSKYFMAEPKNLSWQQHPERTGQPLTPEEQSWFMEQVGGYFQNRPFPILFIPERMKTRTWELAEGLSREQLSRQEAERALEREWPGMPEDFWGGFLYGAFDRVLAEAVQRGSMEQESALELRKKLFRQEMGQAEASQAFGELPEPLQNFLNYGTWDSRSSPVGRQVPMNEKQRKRLCKKLIMQMNAIRQMTDRDRKRDLLFGFLFSFLVILVPMLVVPILYGFRHTRAAVIVLVVSVGLGLGLGLGRRRRILRGFYQVSDAHRLTEVRDGSNEIGRLCTVVPTLVFGSEPAPQMLDLFYNWLCRRRLIQPGESLTVWQVTGAQLAPYVMIPTDPSADLLLVPLEGRMPDDLNQFTREAGVLKLHILSEIAKKPETGSVI